MEGARTKRKWQQKSVRRARLGYSHFQEITRWLALNYELQFSVLCAAAATAMAAKLVQPAYKYFERCTFSLVQPNETTHLIEFAAETAA